MAQILRYYGCHRGSEFRQARPGRSGGPQGVPDRGSSFTLGRAGDSCHQQGRGLPDAIGLGRDEAGEAIDEAEARQREGARRNRSGA